MTELEQAIAQGATLVRYTSPSGTQNEVRYRSLDEMLRLRNLMRQDLGLDAAGGSYTKKMGVYTRGT